MVDTNLFKTGVALLGAGVVLKMTKKMSDNLTEEKGIPKKDGSGRGLRLNRGRGGCEITKEEGQGMNLPRQQKRRYFRL